MAGTIEINGTGGIIEGNLGAANVNVNLDSALFFSGGDGSPDSEKNVVTMGDQDFITTGSMTLSAWIKPETPTDTVHGATIIGKQINYNDNALGYGLYWRHSNNYIYFNLGDGSNGARLEYNAASLVDTWIHIAGTYHSGTKAMVLYVNGVSVATGTATGLGDLSASNSNIFRLGGNGSGASTGNAFFKGYIADARIYTSVKDQSFVQKLAAKINVDDPNHDSNANMAGWWKCNDGSGSEIIDHHNVGTDFNGVYKRNNSAYSTDIWKFDEYSVDVYDNGTTTTGAFEISQGKVEGKALTSLAFDGDDDFVELGSQSGDLRLNGGQASISAWIRIVDVATDDNFKRIIDKSNEGNAAGGWSVYVLHGGQVRVDVNGVTQHETAAGIITDATWHHVTAIIDTTNGATIYVDGVEQTTGATSGGTTTVPTTTTNARIGSWNHSTAREFKGKIRDLKVFDYVLSAEQAASLYSGTYPQTALHQYKLDDSIQGVTTDTAVDSGTSSTLVNGTLTGIGGSGKRGEAGASSGWQNGTLDLDGDLTVAANGTLSAPRGTISVDAITDINGTFTHNNGKFEVVTDSAERDCFFNSSTFYNLTVSSGANPADLNESFTVINNFETGSCRVRGITITMGNDTQSGNILFYQTNSVFKFQTNTPKIYGHSSLFPALLKNTGSSTNPLRTDYAATPIHFKNVDVQFDFNTSGSHNSVNPTIILDGDCEFDAVTVSSGDTLDLNGQRMECSGNFTASSGGCNVDFGAGMLIAPRLNITGGTFSNVAGTSFIVSGSSGGENNTLDDSTLTGDATTNLFINNGSVSCDWSSSDNYAGNVIVGSGTYRSQSTDSNKCNNITVATGSTLDADNDLITCKGDFTTSGGLLGASCFQQDDEVNHNTLNTKASASSASKFDIDNFTIEAWVKVEATSPAFTIFHNGSGDQETGIWLAIWNGQIRFDINGVTNGDVLLTTDHHASLIDNKWHHIAATRNGTSKKIYLDGKLVYSATVGSETIGSEGSRVCIGTANNDAYTFIGKIDEVRFWNDERDVDDIRDNMFSEVTADSSLVAYYKFNEGSSDSVEDDCHATHTDADLAITQSGSASTNNWATAGNFDKGSSTLVMAKSGTQTITCLHSTDINNLTINDGSTTQLFTPNLDSGILDILGNLTVNEKLKNHASSASGRIRMKTAGKTITVGSDVKTTALAEMAQMVFDFSGSMNIPELTTPKLVLETNSNATLVATGDLTVTTELEVNNTTTFNANTNTIALKDLDLNTGGTLDLRNSDMIFNVTNDGDDCHLGQGTLLTGNTTITGHSSATKTTLTARSDRGFEVVGDVKFLDLINEDGELTVIGSVIDCSTSHTGARFIQFHHTLDTQQLLDADEAGDDDLRLEKPALDNANELQTG